DFPDLVHVLLDASAPIGAFVYDGLWLDIGRHEDYQRALTLWEEGHLRTGDPPHRENVPLLSGSGPGRWNERVLASSSAPGRPAVRTARPAGSVGNQGAPHRHPVLRRRWGK